MWEDFAERTDRVLPELITTDEYASYRGAILGTYGTRREYPSLPLTGTDPGLLTEVDPPVDRTEWPRKRRIEAREHISSAEHSALARANATWWVSFSEQK